MFSLVNNIVDVNLARDEAFEAVSRIIHLGRDRITGSMVFKVGTLVTNTRQLLLCQNLEKKRQSVFTTDGICLPAEMTFYESGNVESATWCDDGMAHSFICDGALLPAWVKFEDDANLIVRTMEWCDYGVRHRLYDPARFHFINQGLNVGKVAVTYFLNGEISRPVQDGPAKLVYLDLAPLGGMWCEEGYIVRSFGECFVETTKISLKEDGSIVYSE